MTKDLEQYFKRALSRYRAMPDWEDAVQEALIQVWKDGDQIDPDKAKARAVLRAKGILTNQTGARGGVRPTGHVGRKSTTGTRRPGGDASREKISSYIAQYKALHNVEPGVMEISRAIGIGREAVSQHLKKIHSYGGLSVEIKDIKFERISTGEQDTGDTTLAIQRTAVEWEDDTVTQLTVRALMQALTDQERQVVFMSYWQDMTAPAIGDKMGVTRITVNRWLRAAEAKLREAYEAMP